MDPDVEVDEDDLKLLEFAVTVALEDVQKWQVRSNELNASPLCHLPQTLFLIHSLRFCLWGQPTFSLLQVQISNSNSFHGVYNYSTPRLITCK
ncbi:hypothetical protein MTR_5g087800 [Medicago truncatula]|uniref:Uncharacterized protein n=1 Tax=Medicago truncatula TaxID=3880 RepID=G7K2Y1_MEDTR|nr:hypothetical protein MTR_5g087800 [Medicago truncatula]